VTSMTLGEKAAQPSLSFVYIIGHDGSNLVKIGKADDVAKRLAGIQRMSPVKLRVLAHFPGGFRYEKALHQKFDHLRTYGEWFDFGGLDPVAEVSAAMAKLAEADEAEARAAAERAARPGTVVQIRKKLWVMRGDGKFQCVDSVKGKRRCRNYAVDVDGFGRRRRFAVPGAGFVEGFVVSVRNKAEEERIMLQLCQPHYDRLLEDRYYEPKQGHPTSAATRPMWEPFHPVHHVDLIRYDAVDNA
jgi:hypothetical protein